MQSFPIQEETDDDLRNNSRMEGSPEMTIEFLRTQLLAERSVSRAARQRADELAKRVAELEDQLKTVFLQRKKAEKATIDVLAILENHGMNEFSEELESNSDQEIDQCKCEVSNNFQDGNGSVGLKTRSKRPDEFSTSELGSYPSLRRSMSFKSGKQSTHFREKCMDSSDRRRRSVASSVSESPRLQVGSSCRQMQRSPVEEGSKNENRRNGHQEGGFTTCSEGYSTHSDTGSQIFGGNSVKPVVEAVKEKPVAGDFENQGLMAGATNYLNKEGSCEDMEMAMERQARLIGQYQEEKARREWEEKFREHENPLDSSCEPGNQSNLTEERDKTKVHAPPFPVGNIASRVFKEKPAMEDISGIKESSKSQPNWFQSPHRSDTECFQETKPSGTPVNGSPTTDPAVTHRGKEQEQWHSRNLGVPLSPHSYHHGDSSPRRSEKSAVASPHSYNGYHQGDSSSPRKSEKSSSVAPDDAPELGSVLNALQRAKLSLTQQIKAVPSVEDNKSVGHSVGGTKPEDPVGFRGLFKVPSDFHLEAKNNHDSSPQPSLTQYYPSGGNTPTGSSVYGSERHYSTPNSPHRESVVGRVPTWQPLEARSGSSRQQFSDPRFDAGVPYSARFEFNNPSVVRGQSYSSPYLSPPTYPAFPGPGPGPQIPSNQGPPVFSGSRAGMSPSNQFFYDEPGVPSTYR